MYDLKCKRKGCTYNKNCNCTAKIVEVEKNTGCKTYKPSGDIDENQISKVSQPPIRKNIQVQSFQIRLRHIASCIIFLQPQHKLS